jgi:hypothetical protein
MDSAQGQPREEHPPFSATVIAALEAAFTAFLLSFSRGPEGPVVADGQRRRYRLKQQLSADPDGVYWLFPDARGGFYGRRGDRQMQHWPVPPELLAAAAAPPTAEAVPPAGDEPATAAPASESTPDAPPANAAPTDSFLDQTADGASATRRKPEPAADTRPAAREAVALYCAALGWPVVPLHSITAGGRCTCGNPDCPSPGKHPLTPHGYKDASRDPAVIHGWFAKWSDANYGIVTGRQSRLLVIDVDGEAGKRALALLEAQLGIVLEPCVFTPRGLHVYLRLAPDGPAIPCSAGKLGEGIDVRGDGGYVVGPGSQHATGLYELAPGFRLTVIAPMLEARLPRLLAKRPPADEPKPAQEEQEQSQQPEPEEQQQEAPRQEQPQRLVPLERLGVSLKMQALIRDGKPRGERSNAIRRATLALIAAGWDDKMIHAVLRDPANKLSEKILEQRDPVTWLTADIARTREHFAEVQSARAAAGGSGAAPPGGMAVHHPAVMLARRARPAEAHNRTSRSCSIPQPR